MRVTYFFRKPSPSFFSIEQLFSTLTTFLKASFPTQVFLPSKATTPLALLKNCLYAKNKQAQVNHITGDVYYIALALRGSRTILTIHDLESLYSSNRIKHAFLQLLWLQLPVRKVKFVTVISECSKQKLLEQTGIAPGKVVVIPNCVSFSPEDYRPKDSINTKEPVLLQIGTKLNKNLENVIEAIEGFTCRLLIIGKLSEAQLNLLCAKGIIYENYEQLAYEEVKALYYKSDIVTFISIFEGFGIPILEANALGRPVITSTISAMPEVAGEGALLVDPYSPGEIREAIEKLVFDDRLRSELVAAGYKNVQRFRPEEVAAQYEVLYSKVIEENR